MDDLDALPLLAAACRTAEADIVVAGPRAEVRVSAQSDEERRAIRALLDDLNGRNTVRELIRRNPSTSARAVLRALADHDLVVDIRAHWRHAARFASNPPIAPSPLTVEKAYALGRWRPPSATQKLTYRRSSRVNELAALRRSPDFASPAVNTPEADLVFRHAFLSALSKGDHAPVASAGNMRPLQGAFATRTDGRWNVLWVDHESGLAATPQEVTARALADVFFARRDGWIENATNAGASVAFLLGDPRRTCGKYGNRGYNYMLLEAGAVLQHATLMCLEADVAVRPVGGFNDGALCKLLGRVDLVPLISAIGLPEQT